VDNLELPAHTASPPTGLRARKKHYTQVAIEEAALRLFEQRSYEQTSIQDIADAVMVSPRTFFRYFASKEELLVAPTQRIVQAGIRSLQRVSPAEPPLSALTAMLTAMARQYQEQRAGFLIRYQVAMQTPPLASMYLYALMTMEPTICDALCAHLETVTSQHEIRLLVAICVAAFRLTLTIWLEQEATGDLIALLHDNLDHLSPLSAARAE
jgi:AcrR family transcriptional regulator